MSERQELVDGFQETLDPQSDPEGPPVYLQGSRPRVLSGVAHVLGIGFTLTKSYNLVKVEPSYSSGSDSQVYKRIHRIGQTENCTIWKLVADDSPDELAVLRRAEKKECFIAQAYALTQGEMDELDADMEDVLVRLKQLPFCTSGQP